MNETKTSNNVTMKQIQVTLPSRMTRITSVWYRHFRVYTKFLISNGLPPFLEPLFFLLAIGFGLGEYVDFSNVSSDFPSYIKYLAAGIIVPPAMFTASFECTFGTFIRLEFDKVYDGMLASSMTLTDLMLGEIVFAGTKGFFFSGSVLIVVTLFGHITEPTAVLTPVVGFFIGLMFASLSLFITSFVKNINHFNFYFTGFLTPLFFFSNIVFPLDKLPLEIRHFANVLPLIHPVTLVRACCTNNFSFDLIYHGIYIVVFILLFSILGIRRLRKRIIS